MRKIGVRLLVGAAMVLGVAVSSFAVDGVVLINQATVNAAGGFPYKVTQPGSYKLSGNLVVTALNTDGIDINADNVTLDLNGFSITGPVTCASLGGGMVCSFSAADGIRAFGRSNVTVRNGSVIGFDIGVSIRDVSGFSVVVGSLVEEVHASGNTSIGIQVSSGVVRRNTASANSGWGIDASSSVVTENVANYNRLLGLHIDFGVFGSNMFAGNGADFPNSGSAVSQGNNACGSSAC